MTENMKKAIYIVLGAALCLVLGIAGYVKYYIYAHTMPDYGTWYCKELNASIELYPFDGAGTTDTITFYEDGLSKEYRILHDRGGGIDIAAEEDADYPMKAYGRFKVGIWPKALYITFRRVKEDNVPYVENVQYVFYYQKDQ